MPLSHVSLATGTAQFARMRSFYLTALEPLNYVIYYEKADSILGLQPVGRFPDFWLHTGNGEQTPALPAGGDGDGGVDVKARLGRPQVGFDADSRAVVDQFYTAAIKAGGTCNGKPELRTNFAHSYYAAFVLDPLGNNVEVVHYAEGRGEINSRPSGC
ncbi:hypothetical protein F4808DRAFT_160896 [Astrocystis sublimbata]|nr:hypothetical protein F4808DRAFT_160896 [Astrocystis sublimbata]